MEKMHITPEVVVYRGVLNDHANLLNVIKKTETPSIEGKYYVDRWRSWLTTGKSTRFRTFLGNLKDGYVVPGDDHLNVDMGNSSTWLIRDNSNNYKEKNYFGYPDKINQDFLHFNESGRKQAIEMYDLLQTDENALEQRKILAEIGRAFKDVIKQYSKDCEINSRYLNGDKFDLSSPKLGQGDISFLKYGPSTEMYGSNMAMLYHTDAQQFDAESRAGKFLLTVTMYLSDPSDYKGGELSFLNEANSDVIHYTPKPGDITVFPSDIPYWHAVEKITSGERYLIRTFLLVDYPGSQEWLDNEKKFGIDVWHDMEQKRIESTWNTPEYFRNVIYSDDPKPESDRTQDGMAYYVNKKRGYWKEFPEPDNWEMV